MKSIELLALGLRLVGIYAFILVLQSGLQSYYGFFAWREAEEGVLGLIFMNYMTLSVMAALCVLLVAMPVKVATWLLPKTPENDPVIKGNIEELKVAAFTVLGVYLIANTLPELVAAMVRYYDIKSAEYPDLSQLDGMGLWLANVMVQLVIGIVLCFMPVKLSEVLTAMRRAGLGK